MTKLPLSLHESCVDKFRARDRLTGKFIDDDALEGLSGAMAKARADAERLTALADAVLADKTQTPEANALRLRKEALKLGETAAKKLDAARQRAAKALELLRAATSTLPVPKDQLALQIEGEVRVRLAAMKPNERGELIAAAIKHDDAETLGAYFRGPSYLSGASDSERGLYKGMWRQKQFPKECDREQRLVKALEALDRGGQALLGVVEVCTNSPAAKAAEQGTARAAEAVAAATAE